MPVVRQMQYADCGAACLGMVLAHHGRRVSLDELRQMTGTSRDGVDARAITEAARRYGLEAHGVKADVDELGALPTGSVLHWEFRHFVVLERVRGDRVEIVDPQVGRRRLRMDDVRRCFTGVAVVCSPGPDFEPSVSADRGPWRYLRPVLGQSRVLGRVLATSVLIRLVAMALPVLTGLVVDEIAPRDDRHLLVVVGLAMAAVVVYDFVAALVRSRLLLRLRTTLDVRLTTAFVDHLVSLPYAFFLRRSAGDVMMRLQSNAEVREILTTGALAALLDGGLAVLYLAVLAALSPPLAAVVVLLGLVQGLVLVGSWRPAQARMSRSLEAEARSQSFVFELLAGVETLKASGSERRAVERWERLFAREVEAELARGRLNATVEALVGTLQLGAPLAILVFGAFQVLGGHMSLGTMLAAAALAAGFLEPLVSVVETGFEVSLLRSYMERINDVLDTPREQAGETVAAAGPLAGEVRAENVSFAYGRLDQPVVDNVSLTVAPGQRLGIAGRSGAGKSTLAHLLLGLCRPTAGRVLFDGADLAGLEAGSVRRQIGIVTQQPYVFGATIRDNIAFADPTLPLDAVVEAAKLACVHDDIARMPLGYDTVVGGGGSSLSGGQAQRIALARALVHRPRVLLLDEATSDLDTLTERMVLEHLRSLGCTTILIAHRLSTIAAADVILVLEDGRVAAQGTHGELVGRPGIYRRLVEAQSGLG